MHSQLDFSWMLCFYVLCSVTVVVQFVFQTFLLFMHQSKFCNISDTALAKGSETLNIWWGRIQYVIFIFRMTSH